MTSRRRCCCEPGCRRYSRVCNAGGGLLVVSPDATIIASGRADAWSFFAPPPVCNKSGSAFATGELGTPAGNPDCNDNPALLILGDLPLIASASSECGDELIPFGVSPGVDWAVDLAGNIVSARLDAVFNGPNISVTYPATSNTIGISTLEVEWFSSGGVVGAIATLTTDSTNSAGDRFYGVAQFQCFVIGMVPPTEGPSIEICSPELPPMEPPEPPEWFDPDDPVEPPPPECPDGCVLGPIGWSSILNDPLGPEGGCQMPTKEEWEGSGNTWGCGEGAQITCPGTLVQLCSFGACGSSGLQANNLEALCAQLYPIGTPDSQANASNGVPMSPRMAETLDQQMRGGGCRGCGDGFSG